MLRSNGTAGVPFLARSLREKWGLARVERALLPAAFDADFDFDLTAPCHSARSRSASEGGVESLPCFAEARARPRGKPKGTSCSACATVEERRFSAA